MGTPKKKMFIGLAHTPVPFMTWCVWMLGTLAVAQVGQNDPGKAASGASKTNIIETIGRLKNGDFFPVDLNQIAAAGAVQALPDLKKQFTLAKDETNKEAIAATLVRLGEKEGIYWNYLIAEAASIIYSDAPPPAKFDSSGKLVAGLSPEFLAWTKAHNNSVDEALSAPSKVIFLVQTEDKRAIPFLRRALSSPYYLIQTSAAQGLANLQDIESVPLIIDACRRAPTDAAFAIASFGLLKFDDAQAQKAARPYLPKDFLDALGKEKKSPGVSTPVK